MDIVNLCKYTVLALLIIVMTISTIRNRAKHTKKQIIESLIIFVASFFFFTFVIKNGAVPSDSMNPTLNVGDLIVANGLAYMVDNPQRGDIVIFKSEVTNGKIFIKRIIGLPGDDLMFIDGDIYLNGSLLIEEYLSPDLKTNSEKDFEVPEGCYFVMGDNRDNSYDSRYWDNPFITLKNIKGKMLLNIPTSKLLSFY